VIVSATGVRISGGNGVVADADGIILDGIGSTITNAGLIDSYGSAASLNVREGGTTTIINSGTMDGRVSGIWHKFGPGTLVVVNNGTITSPNHAVLGNDSEDLITNQGVMIRDVDLAGGNDLQDNRGGSVDGAITGGSGNDQFIIGFSAEMIDGSLGFDPIDFSSFKSRVHVDLADASGYGRPLAAGDIYTDIEAVLGSRLSDVIHGNALDNLIVGGGGKDKLCGGAGADMLDGGGGRDSISGGSGADAFQFVKVQGGADLISDFVSGEDMIHLEGSKFGFGTATGAVSASVFVIGAGHAALDADDRLMFDTTTNTLWYDKDGTGSKAAVGVAALQSGATLTIDGLSLI
jgi:Ca2+-binding RTX toxin-like protein